MTHTELEKIADLVAAKILAETRAAAAPRRWLTVTQAEDYVSMSRKTVMSWINTGLIYAHKTTGTWLIDRESIDAWLEEDKHFFE